MKSVLWRIVSFLRRSRLDRELDDDIAAHLEFATADNLARGMPADEARLAAMRSFGGVLKTQEACRDRRGFPRFEWIIRDVRYAVRGLRKTPTFTFVSILTVAVAMGANVAIASLLNAVVLRPLAVPAPNELVEINTRAPTGAQRYLSYPILEAFRREATGFTGIAGSTGLTVLNIRVGATATRAAVVGVTGNFYDVLGVPMFMGRDFADANGDEDAAAPVAVVSHEFWRQALGGDGTIVGRMIHIEEQPLTIIGVAPRGFSGMQVVFQPAVAVPLKYLSAATTRTSQRLTLANSYWIMGIARVREGGSARQAEAQLIARWPAIRAQLASTIPQADARAQFLEVPLQVHSAATGSDTHIRPDFKRPLQVLAGIALVVLLIACANLAGLMLSRATSREHELAMRVALGATRARIAQLLLIEGLILSCVGTVGGILIAYAAEGTLVAMLVPSAVIPISLNAAPDLRVLGIASLAAVLVGVMFSLAPLYRVTRTHSSGRIVHDARTTTRAFRSERALVAIQMALCFVLLASAGLLLRNLHTIRGIESGLDVRDVTIAYPYPQPGGYRNLNNEVYYQQVIERVRALPGVQAVALSAYQPFGGQPNATQVARNDGTDHVIAAVSSVSPGFFRVLGIPLISGRDFNWLDNARSRAVAVVTSSASRNVFGSADPLGRTIRIGSEPTLSSVEIIGVVADAHTYDLKSATPDAVYLPSLQRGAAANYKAILIRGDMTAKALNDTLTPLGHDFVTETRTLENQLEVLLTQERTTALIGTVFGGIAIFLAAIGLYAMVAYNVGRRMCEMGVRLALGAQPSRVLVEIMGDALLVSTVGLCGGFVAAWASAGMLRSLLFGIQPHDALTFAATAILLLLLSCVASLVPARRAARVNPMVALRAE